MAENHLSFDSIPQVLSNIVEKLEALDRKVDNLHISKPDDPDAWLSLKDLCAYLPNHPAEQTVYGWTSTRFIPFHKKGKNIVFRKSEIDEWLVGCKKRSIKDFEREAQEYVNSRKKKML